MAIHFHLPAIPFCFEIGIDSAKFGVQLTLDLDEGQRFDIHFLFFYFTVVKSHWE